MERVLIDPRPDWREKVESQGLFFHTADNVPYWDEHVCYEFTSPQIDAIEQASDSLNSMALETVQHIVDHRDEIFPLFQVPGEFWDFVCQSWDEDEHTIIGRFDLAYDGVGPPRLLEYNADTPTSLLEASVAQWNWLTDLTEGTRFDQYNSIHERLIEAFQRLAAERHIGDAPFYFTSLGQDDSVEDYMTATYLRDVAQQAGLSTRFLPIQDICWGEESSYFQDGTEVIKSLFKLYPWEWLVREEFGRNILSTKTEWYEPAWKMLLSNKAFLVILSQLFGDSPHVLKATFHQSDFGDTWVRKPIFSREGQNIVICRNGTVIADTPGEYDEFPVVFQEYQPLPIFAGNCPVIGSWMINGHAAGIGIREASGVVTNNTSRFVPHRFVPAPAQGRFGGMRKRLLGKK